MFGLNILISPGLLLDLRLYLLHSLHCLYKTVLWNVVDCCGARGRRGSLVGGLGGEPLGKTYGDTLRSSAHVTCRPILNILLRTFYFMCCYLLLKTIIRQQVNMIL